MTESEALQVVRRLQTAIQKARFNGLEALGGPELDDDLLALLQPWIFGDRCLLKATEPILDRDSVEPLDLFNLMTIVNRDDTLRQWCGIWCAVYGAPNFPEPDFEWIRGWTK